MRCLRRSRLYATSRRRQRRRRRGNATIRVTSVDGGTVRVAAEDLSTAAGRELFFLES